MPTIPTGKLELELRRLYVRWLHGLGEKTNMDKAVDRFEKQSIDLIERMGGRTAMLGALADFPVPKRLDLSPHVGTIYSDMKQAAIQAGIQAGLNASDVARHMFRAGMDKSYNRLNRLARTETVSAYWKNAWDSIEDLPELVMVWGAETGPRTCEWCLERDGMVMESSQLRDHPNGRCTPIPTLRSMVEYKGSVDSSGRIFQDPEWTKRLPDKTVYKAATSQNVPTLGSAGHNAAESYSRSTEELNIKLREGRASELTESESRMQAGLLEGLKGKRTTEPIILYRGESALVRVMEIEDAGGDSLADFVGRTIKNPSFLSTSTGTETPREFGDLVFRIKVPTGSNVASIADASKLGFQDEVLIPPGSSFKVTDYSRGELHGKRTYFLDVELVQKKRR